MSLKRDIEAIYVLEPWYSKLRYELKHEGWVQDNVFWEQLKHSLERLTKRVIPPLAESLATYAIGALVEDFDLDAYTLNLLGGLDLIWKGKRVFFDPDVYGWGEQPVSLFYRKVIDNWDRVERLQSPLFLYPVVALFKRLKPDVIQRRDGKLVWYLGAKFLAEFTAIIRRGLVSVQDRCKFSASSQVRWYKGISMPKYLLDAGVRLLVAADRLKASYRDRIPSRILAVNVALNTVHTDETLSVADLLWNIDKDILGRWSKMGVQSKATAKRYLESLSVRGAIDQLLEGQSLRTAVCGLLV